MSNIARINKVLKDHGHGDMAAYHVKGHGYFIDSRRSKAARGKPAGTEVFLSDDFYTALYNLDIWLSGMV